MTRPRHTLAGVIGIGTLCGLLYVGWWVAFIYYLISIT